MWVRSQDKYNLVDVKGCFIYDDTHIECLCDEHEYNILGWMCEPSIEDNQWTLGTYKTEEKAMSVLDELQCRISRSESGVYQMPKDEE